MKNIRLITILALSILFLTNCSRFTCEEGSGSLVFSEKDIASFSDLKVSGDFEVILTQEENYSCKVETYENFIPLIEIENSGNTLKIGTKKCMKGTERSKIYISAPSISFMGFSGAIKVSSINKFDVNKLIIKGSGASNVAFNIDAESLEIGVSGSSKVHLDGNVEMLKFSASGSGFLNASNLTAQKANVNISGSGDCNLHVENSLKAKVSGSGRIKYTGNPEEIDTKISGSGNVFKSTS